MRTKLTIVLIGAIAICLMTLSLATNAQPSVVKVVRTGAGYQLVRNGQPYFIKGGGGDASLQLLHDMGGNSVRTWGADNLDTRLAKAQELGMTVTIGFWLRHIDDNFSYHDAAQVAQQKELCRQAVLKYRNSPALLIWAVGNEMETGQQSDPAVWQAVDDIAAMVKQLDPNHPTMTVIAELGGGGINVQQINRYCPHIDIVGINSYGGAPSVADRYVQEGGVKPYVITEFGPAGVWEIGKNKWGVANELTSTQKADVYRTDYLKSIKGQPLCLGSYAFTWGNKREATATWFGLLLPGDRRLAAADAMSQLWTGKQVPYPCPVINAYKLDGNDEVLPGATVHATLDTSSPIGDPLTVHWVLEADPAIKPNGGKPEAVPPSYPSAIVSGDTHGAIVKMPDIQRAYRLYAYAHDSHGGAAVANIPLLVTSSPAGEPVAAASGNTSHAPKASLPLVIYGSNAHVPPAYFPSGYMGNTAAVNVDEHSTVLPHLATESMKVSYSASDNWAGVVWQSPANDWGDKPGGFNLTGATKLTFWARGAKGGEVVTFKYGLLGSDKAYPDSSSGSLDNVTLTNTWKQYTIDLTGKDLSQIKTGFVWVVAGQGAPVTFYLDDIRYS